jgi:hypothetical protein
MIYFDLFFMRLFQPYNLDREIGRLIRLTQSFFFFFIEFFLILSFNFLLIVIRLHNVFYFDLLSMR